MPSPLPPSATSPPSTTAFAAAATPPPPPPSFPFLLTLDHPLRRRLPLLRLLPFSPSFLLTLGPEYNTSPLAKRCVRSGGHEGERGGACGGGGAQVAHTCAGVVEQAREERERWCVGGRLRPTRGQLQRDEEAAIGDKEGEQPAMRALREREASGGGSKATTSGVEHHGG